MFVVNVCVRCCCIVTRISSNVQNKGWLVMKKQITMALGMIFAMGSLAHAQEVYEGGKGLITLEGPSGMFINPTSGTMPEGYGTAQYCLFFPNNETDVVGHGLMGSYGVTDAVEIGASGNYVDLRAAGDELTGGGPFARVRLAKDDGTIPQVSVGAYSRFGDDALEKIGIFAAAYKRLPISEDGAVKAVGLHAGVKQLYLDDKANPVDDTFSGYAGVEVQLPMRVYAVGEVTSKDDDLNTRTPYAYGVQWRAAGIAMSLAMIQDGNLQEASFYYGIGFAQPF